MQQKQAVRKKYYLIRKKKFYQVKDNFFKPLIKFFKAKFKNKNFKLAIYYPSSFEINVLVLLNFNYIKKNQILLPVTDKKNEMNFFPWKKKEILVINKFGFLEPIKTKKIIPNVIIAPLLAFDDQKHRLGYGQGFYDRYLNKYLKKFQNILTVGVAFSFQKHHKLPVNKNDIKLNFIITEKGIY